MLEESCAFEFVASTLGEALKILPLDMGGKIKEFLKFSVRLSAELLQPFSSDIMIIAKGNLSFIAESSFIWMNILNGEN